MSDNILRECKNALKDTFDFDDFKSEYQRRAVECIMSGEKNVIISISTQGGKSLCYQLPSSLQRDGIILVITPNISLITNQLTNLNDLRIPATSITSIIPESNRKELIKSFIDYENVTYRFLYMTPEMLINGSFRVRDLIEYLMEHNQISHVACDEAHLIVDHDNNFRNAFKSLGEVRSRFPNIPWIALTTASMEIINEISQSLSMIKPIIIKGPSIRTNIFYDVYRAKNQAFVKFVDVISDLLKLDTDDEEEETDSDDDSEEDEEESESEEDEEEENYSKKVYASGIIYCRTNGDADTIAHQLRNDGITAESLYGAKRDVNEIQKRWRDGIFPVLVATEESFGLGIKRTPLKFVVHMSYPKNLRAFYQQSGRVDAKNGYSRIYMNKFVCGEPSNEMKAFIDTKICRHKYIANYFGDEDVDACKFKCDNCKNSEVQT